MSREQRDHASSASSRPRTGQVDLGISSRSELLGFPHPVLPVPAIDLVVIPQDEQRKGVDRQLDRLLPIALPSHGIMVPICAALLDPRMRL
jgi:hypothetical protein